jgi:hypothetical protein
MPTSSFPQKPLRKKSLTTWLSSFMKKPLQSEMKSNALASLHVRLAQSRQARNAGRASTRCYAARAGEVRLLAARVTQRRMQFRAMPCAPPNPSIERTRPGKPGRASHVKR